MSSAGTPGYAAAAAASQQYFCYQCESHVTLTPPPSPTAELVCPNCNGGFLEESDTAPPSNPDNPNPVPNHFFGDNFPFIFSSPSASSGGAAAFSFSGGGRSGSGGYDPMTRIFGEPTPNEFNPFAFLNDYINSLQSRGANIQLVFESPGGGGLGGGGGDFRLPTNFGDYFIGPGLEQLIQQIAENDPNRYGTPPASKSAVEGLPIIKITEQMLASDSSQCAVCKDSFELNEDAMQIPCKHLYHKDCIVPWLELHNSCPVCRYELPTDDPDYENRRMGQTNGNGSRNIQNSSLGGGGGGGGIQENRDNINNSNNNNSPRTVERRFRISLPWLFRGSGSPAETSNSGEGGAGSNDGGNNDANHGSSGAPNTGSGAGGHAREEDLD
ncbi:hypothetical protein ACJIZ3_010045 [Penstemon smallii]|uniref:RING-type E3 ubiquitin transferase n=1 Tax=Penstemon smallii TaxID=265156 RepID=A0ABD3TE92_9LAMI